MSTFAKFFSQKRGDVRKQRTTIEEVLKAGPSTVTKIAEATKFPKDLVVWNLLGMLRWGTIEISGEQEEELVYKVKEA